MRGRRMITTAERRALVEPLSPTARVAALSGAPR